MSEWQPIDSAPKDGSTILVFSNRMVERGTGREVAPAQVVTVRWSAAYGGYWELIVTGSYAEDADAGEFYSHWHAMPKAPDVGPFMVDPPADSRPLSEPGFVVITREQFVKEFGEEP